MTNAMRIALYTPAAVIALAPAGALAVDYMNAEQAQKLMFAQADAFEVREIPLDAAISQQLAAAGVKPQAPRLQVRLARQGGTLLGYFLVDEVIGSLNALPMRLASIQTAACGRLKCCLTAKAMAMKFACRHGASSFWARPPAPRCKWGKTLPISAVLP